MTMPAAKFYCECGQEVWAYVPAIGKSMIFMVKFFEERQDRPMGRVVARCPSCDRKLGNALKSEKPT